MAPGWARSPHRLCWKRSDELPGGSPFRGAGVFFGDLACVGHGSERMASCEMGAFVKLQGARNSALLGR